MRYSFLIACSLVVLSSCSSDPSKLFVKKWQFESFKSKAFDDQMAMLQKAADTTKDTMMKARIKQQVDMQSKQMDEMKKMVLTCNMDGSCDMAMGQQSVQKGKWTLMPGAKKVVIVDDKTSKKDTLNIDELTGDKMTMSGPDGRGGTYSMTYKSIQ